MRHYIVFYALTNGVPGNIQGENLLIECPDTMDCSAQVVEDRIFEEIGGYSDCVIIKHKILHDQFRALRKRGMIVLTFKDES